MHDLLISAEAASQAAIPVQLMLEEEFKALPEGVLRATCEAQRFKAQSGHVAYLSGPDGKLAKVIWGLGGKLEPMSLRALPTKLAAGDYMIENPPADAEAMVALAWALGSYVFDRYKKRESKGRPRLVAPAGIDVAQVNHLASACELAREMVDTPAADMGPLQIETIAREIAEAHRARISVVIGNDLLEENYPAVHAVGRAAAPHRAPRVIELAWREDQTDLPLVALVGKGVVFDSGGLDIKPASGMRNMKKDMGGAAHALALGRLIMQSDLPVRLVVLVAAVENAISGDAFRPGDVLSSRAGKTIEIGNTDAEGRLILADVLARAGELNPTLTFDFATLTGAARVALGPELPPFYTNDEGLAVELAAAARTVSDPLWRMPLWPGYQDAIKSDLADVRNDSADWAQAGSVTAALFLQKFAPKSGSWTHFDIFAWNSRGRAGWPVGGEAQAIRAVHAVLSQRFPVRR